MDRYITLDLLLASHFDVCAITNISCCICISETGQIEQAVIVLRLKLLDSVRMTLMA